MCKVTATDEDQGGRQIIVYTIESGNENNYFRIDAFDGTIYVNAANIKANSRGGPDFTLKICAADSPDDKACMTTNILVNPDPNARPVKDASTGSSDSSSSSNSALVAVIAVVAVIVVILLVAIVMLNRNGQGGTYPVQQKAGSQTDMDMGGEQAAGVNPAFDDQMDGAEGEAFDDEF